MERWREELYHSAKGQVWKNHKYIRKEGKRYIYKQTAKAVSKELKNEILPMASNAVGNYAYGAANYYSDRAISIGKEAVNNVRFYASVGFKNDVKYLVNKGKQAVTNFFKKLFKK